MPRTTDAIHTLDIWYDDLDLYADKLPSKGTIGAALVVLDRLRAKFDLAISSHITGQKAQIKGLSAKLLAKLLKRFGETRTLSAIGGRSNRGGRGDIESLLEKLGELELGQEKASARDELLEAMQEHIVKVYIPRHFAAKKVKATFDRNETTWSAIAKILQDARRNGKAGPVSQHLVGAKLSLRFPNIHVANERVSSADMQTGRPGDFQIGNTSFHVTVAPMATLYDKCLLNLEQGFRVYVLVPDDRLVGTRQNVNDLGARRIAVESIESFVATNLDELAEFDGAKLISGFRRLLATYNQRVHEVELDKSLLIEMPKNME